MENCRRHAGMHNELIEKLPNWLRWVLVPISAVVTLLVVWFLANLLNKIFSFLSGPENNSEKFVSYLIIPGVVSYCSVIASAFMAPRFKYVTAIIVSFIWIFVAGAVTFFTFLNQQWSYLLIIASFIFGVAGSVNEAESFHE